MEQRVSIRSPHRSKGRPEHWSDPGCLGRVSIRSPHRSKGRPPLVNGSEVESLVSIRSPHRSKGRPLIVSTSGYSKPVSIRSPHRSKGRLRYAADLCMPFPFQSAPLTEARGDSGGYSVGLRRRSFNPLPSPKQGETFATKSEEFNGKSFNPLPSPKQGETHHRRLRRLNHEVSIRSPHRSKGRHL